MHIKNLPEHRFICNVIGLNNYVQKLYDESRQLAQKNNWEEHIEKTVCMIPCLHYLQSKDWIARIMGRMAWSYIRLHEEDHAWNLLEYAEFYDQWQAAANYYWASEYSHRISNDQYANKCIIRFRLLLSDMGFEGINKMGDLELAVAFYKKLIDIERQESSFKETNNQSDIGRYFELRARFEQNPIYFKTASNHYELAGLSSYAACCEAFWYLSNPSEHSDPKIRRDNYTSALQILTDNAIFTDIHIRKILIGFVKIRIETCNLLLNLKTLPDNGKAMSKIEEGYKTVFEVMMKKEDPVYGSMTETAARITNLSMTKAWEDLECYIYDLENNLCSDEIKKAVHLDELLNNAQKYLPSYTFLATPK